jgi:hypothetical protein
VAAAVPPAKIGMPLGIGTLAEQPQACVGEPVLILKEEDN